MVGCRCLQLCALLGSKIPANLKLIGGPGSAGTIKINNNITNVEQISIINQSPTGIYEQEIDLKTL